MARIAGAAICAQLLEKWVVDIYSPSSAVRREHPAGVARLERIGQELPPEKAD